MPAYTTQHNISVCLWGQLELKATCDVNTELRVSCFCLCISFFSFLFPLLQEIVVKIVTKKLGEKYHKKKAVVKVNLQHFI